MLYVSKLICDRKPVLPKAESLKGTLRKARRTNTAMTRITRTTNGRRGKRNGALIKGIFDV